MANMTLDIANKITEQLALSGEKIAQLEGKLADLECKIESVELLERNLMTRSNIVIEIA